LLPQPASKMVISWFINLNFTKTIQAIYTIVIHNLQTISNIKHVPKQSITCNRRTVMLLHH
ncbi:hypothetical protein, partial [Listeria monocytogenes]|uniref:hypothetical protein n=1 Tax=Listeria monocytogenes TaxID=1639 RepID=UPI002496AE98